MFSKVAWTIPTAVLTIIDLFKKPKSQHTFGATFEGKFVAKNFPKSPNLVTLESNKKLRMTIWNLCLPLLLLRKIHIDYDDI